MIDTTAGTDSTVEENGCTHNDNNNNATAGKHTLSP